MPTCSLLSCCWKKVFAITSMFSWQNFVSLCPASFCSPRPNFCVLFQLFVDFLLLHSNPLWCKRPLFLVVVLKGLVGLHRITWCSFFSINGWGTDLDYCDVEWFALEMNQDHSVIFEIASKDCISDSFVNYEGYPISSKGFLPTVVDIMVI